MDEGLKIDNKKNLMNHTCKNYTFTLYEVSAEPFAYFHCRHGTHNNLSLFIFIQLHPEPRQSFKEKSPLGYALLIWDQRLLILTNDVCAVNIFQL